jgi:hypothetical protein
MVKINQKPEIELPKKVVIDHRFLKPVLENTRTYYK